MVNYEVHPGPVSGSVEIPPSKSHTLRAVCFSMLAKGKTTIRKYLMSPDAFAMIEAIKQFGAKVEVFSDRIEIEGVGNSSGPAENVIECGNSGQVLRFIGALAAIRPSYTVITGDHSIRHNRPVKPLLDALNQLGVFAESTRGDGYAPVIIKGPMKGGATIINGKDSQPVSGLIIAACFAENDTIIHVESPGELPWIDVTLHWLDTLGLKYKNDNYEHFRIPGNQTIQPFDYTVPGDFSSCAYPLCAAILTDSEITLKNVDMTDVQGDKKVIDVLIDMGANIRINEKERTLSVLKGNKLRGRVIDINDFIDSITILAVVGCFAEGRTEIVNAGIARTKECDRIACIAKELTKMGAKIKERKDGLLIEQSDLHKATLDTYRDHRMVLSLTVAAIAAEDGPSIIRGAEVVKKTYPNITDHLQEMGVQFKVIE